MAEKSDVGERLDQAAGGRRAWYLVTVIDFFSRWIVAWEVVATVHAGVIKAIYETGLKNQGISKQSSSKPELRVDRGSPNTSGITREFFEMLGAELSFARVRQPTDNALTERFYGTIKQEEIYLVGNYPDEISAKEEIGRYIEHYHHHRPHQALMNFTPAHVHEQNNKSRLLAELKEMKQKTRERRKEFWMKRSESARGLDLGVPSVWIGSKSLILGHIRRPFFNSNHRILGSRVHNRKRLTC